MENVKSIVIKRRIIPKISPTQVLLRVRYCGICGSDLAYYNGKRRVLFPYTIGHEYSGIIEQVGEDVRNVEQGDVVVVNPYFVCHKCFFCVRKLCHLCIEQSRRDFSSNGGFAEYVSVDSTNVYSLRENISLKAATLIQPLSCCLHAIDILEEEPPETVLITGAGTIGLLTLEALRHLRWGNTVLISDPLRNKRNIAQKLGADIIIDEKLPNVLRQIKKVSEVGVDVLIECSGSVEAIKNAPSLIRSGGKILLVGRAGDDEDISLNPLQISKRELQILGRTHGLGKFEEAINWISNGVIRYPLYFGKIFPLKEIAEAFYYAQAGNCVKTLVKCS
jgi:L-iditol 2-dehydrogenase